MIIELINNGTVQQEQEVAGFLNAHQQTFRKVQTEGKSYLVLVGAWKRDIRELASFPIVKDVFYTDASYPLVSADWKINATAVPVAQLGHISTDNFSIIAGPCAVENEEQVETIAAYLKKRGIQYMRGGVFKPRSSPYAFRGLGLEGLKMFSEVCKRYDLALVTEIMQPSQLEEMYPYVDVFQVGARNSQNFNLLDALGACDKPVLLKRGISGTVEELLQSAEYIYSAGNEKIILCERGIRSFEKAYRNTFDINAIPLLKAKSHLPVIADPSHGVGLRMAVPAISRAAVAAGADGLILEIHPVPEEALSDSAQTLSFAEMDLTCKEVFQIRHALFGG